MDMVHVNYVHVLSIMYGIYRYINHCVITDRVVAHVSICSNHTNSVKCFTFYWNCARLYINEHIQQYTICCIKFHHVINDANFIHHNIA